MKSLPFDPPRTCFAAAVSALVLFTATLAPASAATFTVLTTNDSGAGSLRQAIADAAASAGPDTIHFDAALDGQTITLSSELTVNDASGNLTIDGRSACATPHGITLSGGGAVRILTVQAGSAVTLRYLTLTGGTSVGDGSGIRNEGTVAMMDCTIENCQAANSGGGVANMLNATATLERCTLSGNDSASVGGGVYNYGTCTLRSCTLSGNRGGLGGAVYNEGSGAVVLSVENSTIAGNQADIGGGIGSGSTAPQFHLENSIVADNTAALWPDLAGAVTTAAGRNLVEDPTGATGLGAGDLTGIDPQLGSLADNGGPARTHLPGPGSPAIDSGIPTTRTPGSDQRLFAREIDRGDPDGDGQFLDIGAVEVGGPGGPGEAKQFAILNPAESDGLFGATVTVLPNGNFVVTDPGYDLVEPTAVADVGAVYLYDGGTLEIVSILTGSSADDQVGGGGVTVLSNGNYVVRSQFWDNGGATEAGAVTWGDGTTGVTGAVSAANSLVGSSTNDQVGSVFALANGNYVVNTFWWDHGATADAGAVTWGDGTTGVTGAVSAANSLVGSSPQDQIGNGIVTVLTNGNYVVRSQFWDNGGATNAGAVTWGDGTMGVTGAVSAANSLVGTSVDDRIGSEGVVELTNGNYVVSSRYWDDGGATDAGAVTWGDGTSGVTGVVSAANSLVGSTPGDQIGRSVTALSNGNYVASSISWDHGPTVDVGAVTWGGGTTGVTGVVSIANSLVGSSTYDWIGSFITALVNGNYVVSSIRWDDGATADVGAVTWGNGTTGRTGVVSAANSLVGSSGDDRVGSAGVTALTNGNYVARSHIWDNGGTANAGAATWGDGTTGVAGAVSPGNSLVGSSAGDQVGLSVIALTNGHYVLASANWDDGATADVGAVTWGNGTAATTGVVSAGNSLIGGSVGDRIGVVTALANGNYVVASSLWDNGPTADVGALTWADGTTGIVGTVNFANSLVGGSADNRVGSFGVTALASGNYVVASQSWDDGATVDVGAVTWGDGTVGVTGVVSAANSLVGSHWGDQVGGVTLVPGGHYVVRSPDWNGTKGAVTLGDSMVGTRGTIDGSNSVLGTVSLAGDALVFDYDPVHARLIVGDPAGGRVSLFSDLPEIVVELPSGVNLPTCGTAAFAAPAGSGVSRTFTIRNTNPGDLTGLNIMIDGVDASLFAVTARPTAPVGGLESTAFTVRFAPISSGPKIAVLHLGNNDPDEHPFDIALSGRVLVPTEDSDGDGLNDVSEFQLANFAFDWEVSQPALVADLFGNLGDAVPNLNAEGFYTTSQVHDLYLGTPLIQGDLDAGTATLTMWIEKSENMVDFFPFPMTDPQTTINGLGQLEFDFPLTNGAAFFKLGTSGD